jgi:hypothetical protein
MLVFQFLYVLQHINGKLHVVKSAGGALRGSPDGRPPVVK